MTRFPHKEDSAGKLRDKHETGKSSEALLADDQILVLAKILLGKDEYSEAEKLALMLTQSKKVRDTARVQLLSVLKPPPKRPIYYLEREILSLPRWTRNAMRFLGDCVDMLVKAAAFDVIRNDRILYNVSLGPAIRYFEKAYPGETDLARQLGKYNQFSYKVAKHDMVLPQTRKEHRFTSREVVLCIYISKKLGQRLVSLSELARRIHNDEPINQ